MVLHPEAGSAPVVFVTQLHAEQGESFITIQLHLSNTETQKNIMKHHEPDIMIFQRQMKSESFEPVFQLGVLASIIYDLRSFLQWIFSVLWKRLVQDYVNIIAELDLKDLWW